MSEKVWLSPTEVAEYTGVNVQTVRRWIQSGRLKSHRLSHKVQRVLREDIDALFGATAEVQDAD